MSGHRRHLHRHPEIGLDLPGTHEYVGGVLADLGLDVERHESAGLTARVAGSSPDGVVSVLRADMDALPIEELSGVDFGSIVPGAMHACGHDLHMAMLLGAAKVMTARPPLRDTVLVFQPGEEADRGAVATLQHENLQITGPATAFAIHVHAQEPVGTILHRGGTFMAAGDWFTVDVTGPGGHASQPHLVGNPIDAAADLTVGLHSIVADLEKEEPAVVTVTECQMGNTVNVIPAHGRMRGTIRTLSPEARSGVLAEMAALAEEIASRRSLDVAVTVHEGYPAVVNDDYYVDALVGRLRQTEMRDLLRPMPAASMVIEDFAYFLQRWPGAMVYLGANVEGCTAFNHADNVQYDERAFPIGAALHLEAADGMDFSPAT